MHTAVFAAFDRLCTAHRAGGVVLEIGATLSSDTLLNLPALAGARERIGVNLSGGGARDGFRILQANANDLRVFPDMSFDTVLSNATLEHDARFWLTVAEIRRVLKPGGLCVIGVPGYREHAAWTRRMTVRASRVWRRPLPGARRLEALAAATPTLLVHNYPGDFYRFSEQAMRQVLLEGLAVLDVVSLLSPPRLVGVARRAPDAAPALEPGETSGGNPPMNRRRTTL